MVARLYRTGEFARRVGVSSRTLRYYDSVGLLRPTHITDAGYRLYSNVDLVRLQQILALKYLGFSLAQIQHCLRHGPQHLPAVLESQKAMVLQQRAHLDRMLCAIERAQDTVAAQGDPWPSLVYSMEVFMMDNTKAWQDAYFTPEQQRTLSTLSAQAYADEARQHLANRPAWTDDDQKRVDADYAALRAELQRLVTLGADPSGPEAQAAVRQQRALIHQFTQGNPAVQEGLSSFWRNHNALPANQRPISLVDIYGGPAAAALLEAATAIYEKNQTLSD